MKKIFFFLLLFFITSISFATHPKKIIFFGDSLSDNGNIYKKTLFTRPKSPPYFSGCFTNGFIWTDRVGEHYFHRFNTHFKNYAYGGATVLGNTSNIDNFKIPTFSDEVSEFLELSKKEDKSKMLFVIWIGANDYFSDIDVEDTTTKVIANIASNLQLLINNNAKYFLILNLPDLANCPYSKTLPYIEKVHQFSVRHNEKLAKLIADLQNEFKDVKFINLDVFTIVNDISQNPEKYNQKYHKELKNFIEPCWTGGYSVQKLLREKAAAKYLNSPSLAIADANGKAFESGEDTLCERPDEYFFWDKIHPSATAHDIFAQIVIEKLDGK